jgi:hypothetical protein
VANDAHLLARLSARAAVVYRCAGVFDPGLGRRAPLSAVTATATASLAIALPIAAACEVLPAVAVTRAAAAASRAPPFARHVVVAMPELPQVPHDGAVNAMFHMRRVNASCGVSIAFKFPSHHQANHPHAASR